MADHNKISEMDKPNITEEKINDDMPDETLEKPVEKSVAMSRTKTPIEKREDMPDKTEEKPETSKKKSAARKRSNTPVRKRSNTPARKRSNTPARKRSETTAGVKMEDMADKTKEMPVEIPKKKSAARKRSKTPTEKKERKPKMSSSPSMNEDETGARMEGMPDKTEENNDETPKLKKKVGELEKIKMKNFQLEQQVLNHTRTAESSVRDFEQVEKLSTQLNIAEQDNAELKATISHMERILEMERQDRAAMEEKTLGVLADVKKKWSRAEEERMEVVRAELTEQKERAANFESKYRETQSDLKKCHAELEATISVKTQLKNKLKDYKQRLENVAAVEDKRSQVSCA